MRGTLESAARPGGAEQSVLDRKPKSVHRRSLICLRHLQISKSDFLAPPIIPVGGQRIPAGRPKKPPDRLFCRSKFRSFFDIDFWSIWGRLGAPSWGHFRPFWRPSWAKFGPKRVLKPTWPNLAAIMAENDPQMGPQDEPKSTKNRCQKTIKILIEKRTAGVRLWGPAWRTAWSSWGEKRGV